MSTQELVFWSSGMRNLTPEWNNPSASPAASRRLPDGRQHRECTMLSNTQGSSHEGRRALIKSLRHIALVGSQEGHADGIVSPPTRRRNLSSTTMGTAKARGCTVLKPTQESLMAGVRRGGGGGITCFHLPPGAITIMQLRI